MNITQQKRPLKATDAVSFTDICCKSAPMFRVELPVLSVFLTICGLVVLTGCKVKKQTAPGLYDPSQWTISAPAGSRYAHIDRADTTVLPNGRLLTPMGRQITVAPHPYGLTLSNNDSLAVTANSGIEPFSVSIIRNILSGHPVIQQIPPGVHTNKGILAADFMGLAISPGNDTLYVAGGGSNAVYLFNLHNGEGLGKIDCSRDLEGGFRRDGYIGDMVMTHNGSLLYAVDQINFCVLVIDTHQGKVIRSVDVGRYPYGIALTPDEKQLYVANVGMYRYHLIGGVKRDSLKQTAIKYPPFANGSKEARLGIHSDTLNVAGLGDPNVPSSESVWKLDVSRPDHPEVTAKIKTGILVGQKIAGIPAVGGASPNSLVATNDYVFVSNGDDDNISVISTRKDTVIATIPLQIDERLGQLRGIIPFGLAISPDQKRLYVAESGINAVGVIDIDRRTVIGHIPVGWFPSKLKISKNGKDLIVANAKGFGSGPNGGPDFHMGPEGSYIGDLMKGTVSVIRIPDDDSIHELTQKVISNNFHFQRTEDLLGSRKSNPVPLYPGQKTSPIRYVVYITKENRTYDEVFGQVKKGRGDPLLARFGRNATVLNPKTHYTVPNVTVMPNHLALAHQFAISDNYYVDSDVSADGHRWLVDTYPNEWVEANVQAAYGGDRRFRIDSKAPGIYAYDGASGAIYPEDYNELGSLWENLGRNHISFFNFGEGLMFSPNLTDPSFIHSGYRYVINFPVPAPMYSFSSHIFPTWNMGIPDQYRADMFEKEVRDRWLDKNKPLPSLLTMIIGADHGTSPHPKDGFPYLESYMADNDLALGRIVDFLSHTPYWKHMAIIVTEDDAQGGVDHIDAHRSILMVISPYAKHDYVSHMHVSFGSIFKTIWNILGANYINQYDAGATDLSVMFTDKPDTTPYKVLPEDKRIFDLRKVLTPVDKRFDWKAVINSRDLDDPQDMARDNRQYEKELKYELSIEKD